MKYKTQLIGAGALSIATLLSACGGDDDKSRSREYLIRITNVTANQPLSPAAVILHDNNYTAWELGFPATDGLEILAEDGSPTALINEAENAIARTQTSNDLIMPGHSTTVTVRGSDRDSLQLTIASMPVNTNDAFSGTTGWNIGTLDRGASTQALLPIYDAGTEANTESNASIPGPAAGGEGFNVTRDDVSDAVSRHPGVVTADDGLASSALDESHRFDQGAIYVSVTRIY